MKNSSEKIYVMVGREKVEVSIEVKKAYENMQDGTRIRQHRRGECSCPFSKGYTCTTDCTTCKFRIFKDIYFDGICSDEDEEFGDEFLFLQTRNDYIAFDEKYANREECKEILKRVYELMPELIEVGNLRLSGYTNSKVAEMLGTKRSTLDSRIAKVYNIIKKEFPDAGF